MLVILTFWTGASLSCSYDARCFHAECLTKSMRSDTVRGQILIISSLDRGSARKY